jgi:hypothetical protein
MSVTVNQIVSDVELQLYQGQISDDAATERAQIKFWLSYHLNQLVATECNEKVKRGESLPAIYQTMAALEIPDIEERDDVAEIDERVFIEMDEEILDLNKDAGVIAVLTEENDEIKKATLTTILQFKHLKFGGPSLDNLLYYREGQKIYIYGFKPSDVPFSTIQVWYVPKQDLTTMADSDEVKVSDLVLPQLIASAVETGKLQLFGSQADLENDGADKAQPVYHQQIRRPE